MRRWQEDGEVQDSEDEELGLSSHPLTSSPLQEQPQDVSSEKHATRRPVLKPSLRDDQGNSVIYLDGTPSPDQASHRYLTRSETKDDRTASRTTGAVPTTNWLLDQLSPSTASQESSRSALSSARQQVAIQEPLSTPSRSSTKPNGLSSLSSSPLSELTATPPSPPRAVTRVETVPNLSLQDTNHDPEYEQILRALEAENEPEHVHDRSLRQRTTKQLHPFLVDRARYLRLCKDRGMRPVRVLETTRPDDHTQLDSSQDFESQFSAHPPHSSQRDLGLLQIEELQDQGLNCLENDFRDDDAARNRAVVQGVQSGRKRRKLAHPARDAQHQEPAARSYTIDVLSVPPSPPLSPSEPLDDDATKLPRPKFRLPLGMTPKALLPTPQVSSEPRSSGSDQVQLDYPPTSRTTRRSAIVLSDTSSASSDSDDQHVMAEVGADRGLNAQKKRIRGVLPASWLKIDLLAQAKRQEVQQRPVLDDERSPPSSPSIPQKGIARKINNRQHVPTPGNAVLLSDDESLSDDGSSATQSKHYRQQRLHFDASGDTDMFAHVDEMEHDWTEIQKATVSRRAAPRLGILDILRSPDESIQQPQFMRLAARAARRAPDGARHSPTSKYVHLATRDDTAEVQQTLSAWREGSILPRGATPARQATTAATVAVGRPTPVQPKPRRPLLPDYRPQPRPAQLESLESDYSRLSRAAAFQRRINVLTSTLSRQELSRAAIQRWQVESSKRPPQEQQQEDLGAGCRPEPSDSATLQSEHLQPRTRTAHNARSRKRVSRRVAVEQEQFVQAQPLVVRHQSPSPQPAMVSEQRPVLDMSNFSYSYAADLGVEPFAYGTAFPQSTFVGSGDFAASLSLANRPLYGTSGRISIQIGDQLYHWAAWTEEVRAGLFQIPELIATAIATISLFSTEDRSEGIANVAANVTYLLQSIVRYCTRCLYFHDAIDRQACVESLCRFCDDIHILATSDGLIGLDDQGMKIMMLQYALALAAYTTRLATNETIRPVIRTRCEGSIRVIATSLANGIVKDGSLSPTYLTTHPEGSQVLQNGSLASSIIVLHHSLQLRTSGVSFWQVINSVLNDAVEITTHARTIETIWQTTFLLLPFLDFSDDGTIPVRSKYQGLSDDWALLKLAAERVFKLYDNTVAIPGTKINSYIRTMFHRSMSLITHWRWWKCEAWLATIYDFFISRKLAPLKGEVSMGSPAFLDALTTVPDLHIQSSDSSYTMFLKLVAVGIGSMHKESVYTDKKTVSHYWRLIPGAPKTYRKDADIAQIELDSLRNHYDLLSTLYYASPSSNRLPVSVLTGLVDHKTSHRAACRISVKTWTRLMSFQASLDEPVLRLDDFCGWFHEIKSSTVTQYRLARTEAEEDFLRARSNTSSVVTIAHLETVVASNQNRIAATLVDILAGVERSITSARDLSRVLHLATNLEYWKIFVDSDVTERPLKPVIMEGLKTVHACLRRVESAYSLVFQQTDEDSQDYGDASLLDQYMPDAGAPSNETADLVSLHVTPMAHLISNAFGAEPPPEDSILSKAIDVWSLLLKNMVKLRITTWDDVLEGYSPVSWRQLRDTAQYRIYTPKLISTIISNADDAKALPFGPILTAWLTSTVERESVLKFQHDLTTAMLNNFTRDAVLYNLPFSQTGAGIFRISMHELRQCRLALLAAVFSNMRDHLDIAYTVRGQDQERRRLYADTIREMMVAMRRNYVETQPSNTSVADAGTQDSYVEFVQAVVSLMQQHTSRICPVDRFFTDSIAFPLPADDPTYLVGRLKSYSPELGQTKTQKELTVFLRTVCERALVDDQQPYLVSQLVMAVGGDIEQGCASTPSLRSFLLNAILPAYINLLLAHSAAWRLASPMLDVAKSLVEGAMYAMDINNPTSMRAMEDMICSIVRATTSAGTDIIMRDTASKEGVDQALLRLIMLSTESMPVVEYLIRLGHAAHAAKRLSSFNKLCEWYEQKHQGLESDSEVERISRTDNAIADTALQATAHMQTVEKTWAEARRYMQDQVSKSLTADWKKEGSKFMIRRGTTWKTVSALPVDAGAPSVLDVVRQYTRTYRALFTRRPYRQHRERKDPSLSMSSVLVI
ncbi:hypothetical protein AMS68_003289 [Peltaster fructicola]|uniref:Uncharacterized protein n=1 Tax=Peltaster fructicola TaxID=286661 RepID=A0A6H0XSM9_9PEZI|nr:hypothetical protein AMS68_003289 [Peltaster fructicola]